MIYIIAITKKAFIEVMTNSMRHDPKKKKKGVSAFPL